jgi:hypothetical protein
MRATRLLLLTLPLAFAAAAGAALACGPMSGSGSSGSNSGGSGRGGYDNGAAERQRQGVGDAAGANLGDGDNGGGRRSSPDAGRDLSGQISAIAAAEDAQAAQDQHPKKPLVSLGDIPGAFDANDPNSPPPGPRNTFMNGDTDKNPDWLAWNTLPWWDRLDADVPVPPVSNRPIARPFDPIVTGTCTPEFKDRDFAAENRQAEKMARDSVREANDPAVQQAFRDAQAQRAKQFQPQAQPERPKTAAWWEWNDKSWIERQFEDEPPMYPKHHDIAEPTGGAGVRG